MSGQQQLRTPAADTVAHQAKILHLHALPRPQRAPALAQPVGGPHRPARQEPPEHQLDDEATAVYLYALRRGCVIACPDAAADLGLSTLALHDAVERLAGLHLLRADPGDARRLTPLDPEVAAACLVSPLEAEIHHRRDLITGIRAQLGTLLPRYEQMRQGSTPEPYVRALRDDAEVRGALHRATGACRSEVLSVRPRDATWDDALDEALARDTMSTVPDGVRVLYQHSARADLVTRARIRRIAASGAQVRTTNHLSRPFLVFDRATAFIPEPWGALEVSNPPVAQLLCDVFDDLWNSALPYSAVQAGYQGAGDEIQKTIAKLLAEGLTDEVIARRVGMSLRACRRHIAALLKNLNAVSRFQAGTRAARVGLVVDD